MMNTMPEGQRDRRRDRDTHREAETEREKQTARQRQRTGESKEMLCLRVQLYRKMGCHQEQDGD